ncbi:MAG: GIY-YIG nuclease family protein [Actinomycetota bacterium]
MASRGWHYWVFGPSPDVEEILGPYTSLGEARVAATCVRGPADLRRTPFSGGIAEHVETVESAREDGLTAERDCVVRKLESAAGPIDQLDLPESAGIYAVWPSEAGALSDLGLREFDGQVPLAERPLYLGKEERSLTRRVATTHFASGDTGHSTLRRSLGALLDLESTPRKSRQATPDEKQLATLIQNYDLEEADDERLTEWMSKNLTVSVAPSSWKPLRDLERAVGAVLKPPLDQDRPPMWEPNPWREQVALVRGRLRERARRAAEQSYG